MRQTKVEDASDAELVARFIEIGIEQDDALLGREIARFNRLFDEKAKILGALKLRAGDGRVLLTTLYSHENAQVRLNAAKATLAVAPIAARQTLEALANSRRYPQAGDAGMALDNLDRGIFKPT
jgi:hypothetical protein